MKKIAFILCFITILGSVNAKAQNKDPHVLFNQGKVYFLSKEYSKAYDVLQKAFLADPGDLNVSFYMGRAAFEKGDFEAALMAFDRVLIMNPDAIRVKLEIARCHMQLGALQTARQYFYQVLNANPPKSVVDNVEIFLAAIKASEKKHFFTGSLSYGLSYDNNARSAPGDQFPYSGLDRVTPSDQVNDNIHSFTTGVNHIYKFEDSPYSWKTTLTNLNSTYSEYKDLDIHLLGVSSGPVYQGVNSLFEIHASLNNLKIAYDEYVQPTGLGGSATFIIGPNFLLNSSIGLEKKKYSKAADIEKDATNYFGMVGYVLMVENSRFTVALTKERENADVSLHSYNRLKWDLRCDMTFPAEINIFANIIMTKTGYDSIKTGESVKRSDDVIDFSVGGNKMLWVSKDQSQTVSLQIDWTYTDANSNIGLHKYTKQVVAGSLSFGF